MLQCVEGAFTLVISRLKEDGVPKEDTDKSCLMVSENEDNLSFELTLASVLQGLKHWLPSLLKIFQEELIEKLSTCVQVPGALERFPGSVTLIIFVMLDYTWICKCCWIHVN